MNVQNHKDTIEEHTDLSRGRPRRAVIDENNLLPGDHIYAKRKGRFYAHQGIYTGNGKVIHFTGSVREKIDPEVRETDLSKFLKGSKLRRREHDRRLPRAETLMLARSQLGNKNYSLLVNNCEHFANYCVAGKKKSRQLKKVVVGLSVVVVAGVALGISNRTS